MYWMKNNDTVTTANNILSYITVLIMSAVPFYVLVTRLLIPEYYHLQDYVWFGAIILPGIVFFIYMFVFKSINILLLILSISLSFFQLVATQGFLVTEMQLEMMYPGVLPDDNKWVIFMRSLIIKKSKNNTGGEYIDKEAALKVQPSISKAVLIRYVREEWMFLDHHRSAQSVSNALQILKEINEYECRILVAELHELELTEEQMVYRRYVLDALKLDNENIENDLE